MLTLRLSHPSKVGTSFDLAELIDCPGSTELCRSMCYVKQGHYSFPKNVQLRIDQSNLVRKLLKANTLVEKLSSTIKNVASLRIHSSGDFFSSEYVKAWIDVAKQHHGRLWTYTRSWRVSKILPELAKLAALENVKLWISCDNDTYITALAVVKQYPQFAGIAFMQTECAEDAISVITTALPTKNVVIFPCHHSGGLRKNVSVVKNVPNCPSVIGKLKHDKSTPPCLACRKCLPA